MTKKQIAQYIDKQIYIGLHGIPVSILQLGAIQRTAEQAHAAGTDIAAAVRQHAKAIEEATR